MKKKDSKRRKRILVIGTSTGDICHALRTQEISVRSLGKEGIFVSRAAKDAGISDASIYD